MCFLAGFTSIVILAAYSASLTSHLTAQNQKPELPFDTLQGFYDDGSYKLEAVKSSVGIDLLNVRADSLLLGKSVVSSPVLSVFSMFSTNSLRSIVELFLKSWLVPEYSVIPPFLRSSLMSMR